VKKRLFQRWSLILGLIAILGAVVTVPLTASSAMAKADTMSTMMASAMSSGGTTGEMPCHKAPKHCPDCPQKGCSDLGMCVMKCFQSFYAPIVGAPLHAPIAAARVEPAPPEAAVDSLIPPLLRPPSV
jgi:hypothetical protein